MEEMQTRYILGKKINNYSDYCPIAQVEGYSTTDGFVTGEPGNEQTFTEADFIPEPGFLVVSLGNIDGDHNLYTAAWAIYHSLTSLFSACEIPCSIETVRTTVELSEYFKTYRANYSHIIFIGHGSEKGLKFLDKPNPILGSEFCGYLGGDNHKNHLQIISLCCHSGCQQFSSRISKEHGISEVIAPETTFDLRWAVHFVTGFLLQQFIGELSPEDALKKEIGNTEDLTMCLWRNGEKICSYD